MSRVLPYQQRFKCFVTYGNKKADVTEFIGGNVILEIEPMLLTHLTFEVPNGEMHSEWIRSAASVEFYGGYIGDENFSQDSLQNTPIFRKLFDGHIRKVSQRPSSDNSIIAVVECIDGAWSKSGYSTLKYRYPSKNSARAWANVSSIKTSEIVSNIVAEFSGFELNLNLGDNADVVYTLSVPIVQDNMSDWAFLRKLAQNCGCYVWTSVDGTSTVINFISRSLLLATETRTEFVFIGRSGLNFYEGSYLQTANYGDPELGKLKSNQILLIKADITEEPAVYGAHITRITDFNELTGEEEEKLVEFDESKDEVVYYELDQSRIDIMEKDPEGRKLLDKIFKMGAFDIPWDVAKPFYRETRIPRGIIDAIDKPLLGITVNAECTMNLDISPQQSYFVHGIGRFSSQSNRSRRYLLKSMAHVFSGDIPVTRLNFVA